MRSKVRGSWCWLAALATASAANAQQPTGPTVLRDFIVNTMKWDARTSGALLVANVDKTYRYEQSPVELKSFGTKQIKVGAATVFAPTQTVVYEDSDLPGPYDLLKDEEKIKFLLSSLSSRDIQRLNGDGLCADDLKGEQRGALLSLVPKTLTYFSGASTGPNGSNGDGGPKTLPDDQRTKVRLQLHKGVSIAFNSSKSGNGTSYHVSSSWQYRGPAGTPIAFEVGSLMPWQPPMPGRIVPSVEKKSDLAWTDPRLQRSISLDSEVTLGDAVEKVRQECGIEVYADARVAGTRLMALGSTWKAADLLRGIALTIGGAYRQIGPSFLLAPNLEGQATKEARLQSRRHIESLQVLANKRSWSAAVDQSGVIRKLGFYRGDTLGAALISPDYIAGDPNKPDVGWVPISKLPPQVGAMVAQSLRDDVEHNRSVVPDEEFKDKVRLNISYGYRLVLPDGEPLGYKEFNTAGPVSMPASNAAPNALPLEFQKMGPGSAVGIRSNDPEDVKGRCEKLKQFAVTELWLDSTSRDTIQAAIDSGIKVDLVIHPWRLLPGESCDALDRNVVGLTGNQLEKIPLAKLVTQNHQTRTFGDSFSPVDPNIGKHIQRLMQLIPAKGLNRIIVTDREPAGYETPGNTNMMPVSLDGPVPPGLDKVAQGVVDFGYTDKLRLGFVRKYRIDPIDLLLPYQPPLTAPAPYFDPPRITAFGPNSYQFPGSDFSDSDLIDKWRSFRHEAFVPIETMLDKPLLALNIPVLGEDAGEGRGFETHSVFYSQVGVNPKPGQGLFARVLTINPQIVEDAQGNFIFQLPEGYLGAVCLDLSEAPPTRFMSYLRYLLKEKH